MNAPPEDIAVQPYIDAHRDQVVQLLAEAYHNNAIEVAVFGAVKSERLRLMQAMFSASFPALFGGTKLVATQGERVLGIIHWVAYPGCRPDPELIAEITPGLLSELGEEVAGRLIAWRADWGSRDPEHAHSHLGPFAVVPAAQGRGVGRRLMRAYCDELDRTGALGYLETDRTVNVRFYEHWGFRVTAESDLLGAQNWFMTRDRSHAATPQTIPPQP